MASAPPSASPQRGLDFGRAFTFVRDDPDWIRKILIGGGFTLGCAVLVGIPFVFGYFARTLRNVADGTRPELPEWDDLSGIFEEGLRLAGVYLAHTLGVMLVMFAIGALLMSPFLLASSRRDPSDAMVMMGALGMGVMYAGIILVSLAMAAYLPAGLTRAALARRAGAAFEWRENLAFIRANLSNYALSLVSYLVASFLSQLGFLLCCVGVFPAAFWGYLVLAHSLGQTAQLQPGRLTAP